MVAKQVQPRSGQQLVLRSYGIFAIWCAAAWRQKLPHNVVAPACKIGTSNFFNGR